MRQHLTEYHPFWNPKRIIFAIILSLCLHLIFIFLLPYTFDANTKNDLKPTPEIDKRVKLLQKESLDKRIVDLLQPETKDIPLKSDYYSTKNTSVKKQSKAKETQNNPSKPKAKKRSYNFSLSPQYILNDISKQSSASAKNYLPDIDVGNETLLNTQKFKYASFFIRMKRQLESEWAPRPIISQKKLYNIFYETKLKIILDQNGSIIDVRIASSSGNELLDNEALRSVRIASPYPNPPKQLFNQNGELVIPNWSFIISRN